MLVTQCLYLKTRAPRGFCCSNTPLLISLYGIKRLLSGI